MSLDKNRIQGFGSDGSVSKTIQKVTKCPSGHPLKPWAARQGTCDGCGKRVQEGESVMDCRLCNWYVCLACVDKGQGSMDSWSAVVDQFATPAMKSAIDNIALQVNDVMEAAAEDMKELGIEVKSAMAGALGLDSDEEEAAGPSSAKAPPARKQSPSPRSKSQAAKTVTDFCQKYPATRVAPNATELEAFWTTCSAMRPEVVARLLHEELSWAGGELEWQPRLRALYALEHLHDQGGAGSEISGLVLETSADLIRYLIEVHQCKEKATKVVEKLLPAASVGSQPSPSSSAAAKAKAKGKAAAKPKAKTEAKATAKAAAASADLLGEISTPKAASSASSTAKASGAAPLDLMDSLPQANAAPVLDLTAPQSDINDLNLLNGPSEKAQPDAFPTIDLTAAPAPKEAEAFDPNSKPKTPTAPQLPLGGYPGAVGMPQATGMAALGIGVQQPRGLAGPMMFGGAVPFGTPTAGHGLSWPPAPGAAKAPAGVPAKAPAGAPAGGNRNALDSLDALGAHLTGDFTSLTAPSGEGPPKGPPASAPGMAGTMGGYTSAKGQLYIPPAAELTPTAKTADPFEFVSQHTGLEATTGK